MKISHSFSDAALLVIDMTDTGLECYPADQQKIMVAQIERFIEETSIRPIFIETDPGFGKCTNSVVSGGYVLWQNGPLYPTRSSFIKKLNSAFTTVSATGFRHTTGLHEFLQKQGIGRLFIAGVETPFCCWDSAVDGHEHGYDVTMLSDLTWSAPSIKTQLQSDISPIKICASRDI
jgi:nicotinamidase-related amidase